MAETDSMESGDMTNAGGDWDYNTCYQHYQKQHSYIVSWVKKWQSQFCMSPYGPKFREWCEFMSNYHAAMAEFMWRNYLAAAAVTPLQRDYDWHCSMAPHGGLIPSCVTPSVSDVHSHKVRRKGRARRRRLSRARKRGGVPPDIELHIANIDPAGDGLDVDLGDGNENLEFEFEVTEDLVKFFAETARHRKERELMKVAELNEQKNDETTANDLCTEAAVRTRPTVLPPNEQVGAKRLSEMRELYGAGTAMIHGMETAMQLSFDRNTDRHKPRPWPALPLNMQFD